MYSEQLLQWSTHKHLKCGSNTLYFLWKFYIDVDYKQQEKTSTITFLL